MKIKIKGGEDLVEFEGSFIKRSLKDKILKFRDDYKDNIIEKPKRVLKDSKGNDINQNGMRSFVRIIFENDENVILMRSKDNTSAYAQLYHPRENIWKSNSGMWQEYVEYGSEGMDYIYVDDLYVKKHMKIKEDRNKIKNV